ncbi:energy transducer TonB [Paucihalobacter ruber]|uniref:Energy transducer TonB n=1 Tax=Paucihalobacter ruber TaxID=2567861 RepID=A0A506PLE9_9FLAO|nr:energy transducer TonB [Paucihalobacter ruber]TPV33937.1 energy transducer TonB [Paucihalobacter ruber]
MKSKKNPNLDVGRNSSIYFAVGLNVMLLLTYLALEHRTYEKSDTLVDILQMSEMIEEDIPMTTINIPPPPPPPQITEVITVIENTEDIEETVVKSTEIGFDDVIEPAVEIKDLIVEEVEEDIVVPFAVIERVPTFPGCTGNNDQLKACFQEKMQEHLKKHFKYPEVATELGIYGKVFVLFQIDKNGLVTKIKTRGPDQILEKEAERIISLLPKMEPGKQRNKPVAVPYSIPINFKLVESN